ncbi:MAG TPA: RagB/SusD family nutrient uptake outer membrane protein [Bacteroidales bacterium]|nr:RagB/SusD family nutrient uptake outer membrane protein [Bacteroidales bacterium]
MKLRNILAYSFLLIFLLSFNGCVDNYLDVLPEDKITSGIFPQNEKDVNLLLNGVYSLLQEVSVYNEGLYGFGVTDGATPNAYNWGNLPITKIGNGTLSSSDGGILTYRWTRCYRIIFATNYLLREIEKVELSEDIKSIYIGEAHFLRGLAYSILVESYGGVPIMKSIVTTNETKTISRSTAQETWDQVISDYDIAIEKLKVDAPKVGRATKGAALGMKMRACLYQNKYDQVLQLVEQIDALGKYSLFPSYEGLFKAENENNQEVLFDIQYMEGENSQGSYHDQYCGTALGSWIRGNRYVPISNLVDAYEMIDGSNVDPADPYVGRDPRMDFTILRPGSWFCGYQFPSYLYPGGAGNHPTNRIKHLGCRKYRSEPESAIPVSGQSYINNIVLRYADVLLSKAEALIETDGDIDEAISLINRIRTERVDVKITALPMGLSQNEAREKLRHERRIEFALEGLYWQDVKRWNIGSDLYPIEIRDHLGNLVDTKFPNGYDEKYNLLPIPDSELSMNHNLVQNEGW